MSRRAFQIDVDDPRVEALDLEGLRPWWDTDLEKVVTAATVGVPWGCDDWDLCTFCTIPRAVEEYQLSFYQGEVVSEKELSLLFEAVMRRAFQKGPIDTVFIFNGGSAFAMPETLQERIVQTLLGYPSITRVVIESKASLFKDELLDLWAKDLKVHGIGLTIRIGVETFNARVRNNVLRKGDTDEAIKIAVDMASVRGVSTGGYVILKPAGFQEVGKYCLDVEDHLTLDRWSVEEALATLGWVLDRDGGLGMTEVYMRAACVGEVPTSGKKVNSRRASFKSLWDAWKEGTFRPATPWMLWTVLTQAVTNYGKRVHLLPHVEHPPLRAVPSSHSPQGLPQDLRGAHPCDQAFHEMFDRFRETMDPSVLRDTPKCPCRPEWITDL